MYDYEAHQKRSEIFFSNTFFCEKFPFLESKMAAADATVMYKIGLMARCKQVTAKTELRTAAPTWYIIHDVIHNAHDVVHTMTLYDAVQRGGAHSSKPGQISDCSCCRHMHHMEPDVLSVTHVRPWSLCTETAAWFRLYPFTNVQAAYSDS
jgi:hypothetical protein